MYYSKVSYDDTGNPIEVELICDKCGKIIQLDSITLFDRIQPEYCIVNEKSNIVCECGNKCKSGLVEYKKHTQIPKAQNIEANIFTNGNAECPYCHSKNTKKISGVSRVASVGFFGFASKKIGKQWHCNKCGSDF